MKKRNLVVLSLVALIVGVISCTPKKANSKPNFIFKEKGSDDIAAEFNGVKITNAELMKGIESEVYEAETKVFEIKMAKLKSMILEKLMEADPKKKGMSNDEYLDKVIAKNIKLEKKEIDAFIKERKIPEASLKNGQLMERIKNYLIAQKKKDLLEKWMGDKTAKSPVSIFMKRPRRPRFNVASEGSPFVGGKDAKVTIVEFSDFQCPFCKKGADIMTALKKKYGSKIKIAFKNFPLPFHNHAKKAAVAGLCANEQGKFWALHDQMFAHQSELDASGIEKLGKKAGLNVDKLKTCISSNKHQKQVEKDIEDGKGVGVKSTPTFFVNGQLVSGAQPVEVFSELIDQELRK